MYALIPAQNCRAQLNHVLLSKWKSLNTVGPKYFSNIIKQNTGLMVRYYKIQLLRSYIQIMIAITKILMAIQIFSNKRKIMYINFPVEEAAIMCFTTNVR